MGFCTGNSGDPIFTEDFGTGTSYTPQLPVGTTTYTFVGFPGPQDGQYTIGPQTSHYGWSMPSDHTDDVNGKALIVNASFTTGEFYTTSIDGLCENTTYEFSSWLMNILPLSGCGGNGIPVNVQFEIWDDTDTNLLASGDTGNIYSSSVPTWEQYGLVFQTLPGQTSVILKMINNGAGGCGNDLAIDDIVFKSCGDLIAVEDTSNNNSALICNSETPYSDILTAIPDFTVFSDHFYQWQVSFDGESWTDVTGETNASISISGITTKTYYRTKVAEFAANLDNSDCITFSDVYEVTINPNPVAPISNGDIDFDCISNQATLSVAPVSGININWFDAAVGGTLVQSNSETYTATAPGIYYAEAVDAVTGCTSTTRVAVNASGATFPATPISDGDVDFSCITNDATLSVTVSNLMVVNWYDAATGGTLLQSDSVTYVATAEGTYYAEAVNTVTGCVSLTRVGVTTSTVLPDAPVSDGDADSGCNSNEATLSVTVPSGITVDWFDAATAGNLLQSNSTSLVVNASGTYYAQATNSVTGCVSATRVAVNGEILTQDDATFSIIPTCDGATVSISGTSGGTFVFNPVPSDEASIDSATGTVTNGASGASYTIEYTTPGGCPDTSVETFNVITADNASFSISPTCDGGVSTITGDAGGSFSFNPVPTDGASVNATTGLITGGVSDTTYTLEYTTIGTCPTTSTQSVTVYTEVTLINPTPLEVCDDGTPDGLTAIDLSLKNAEITGSNPNYSISYYETLAEAEAEINVLPMLYTNTSNGQIIFVKVKDVNTGCYAITTLELLVQQAPIANTPQALIYCDPDNDGYGLFTLTDVNDEITGGATSGLTVTYHETQTNADIGVDAIDTTVSYNNIVQNAQILYVRVESSTIATDCATIILLELIVEPTPQLVDPTPLQECDDISADGYATFDLTSKSDEILNGQDSTQYILSYFETQANAIDNTSPIANPLAYINTDDFSQTIWIRVEDNSTIEGCYKLVSLELIVNPLPVLVTPAPLELCDVNNSGDEQEGFTLEDANDDILNGQTGITLTHYETQLDADNATNPIFSPYINTSNAQTIFVRAENDITGCYNTVTITLRVNPIPSPEPNPTPIEVCDVDNDGFAQFDLEIRTIEITNGELDIAITYHETQSDAETGSNAIIGLYTNIVASNQIIYVRSENILTGCYSLTQHTLQLIVNPAPQVPTVIESYVICDSDDDGLAQFDLTTKDEEILNGQDALAVDLTYHISAANAETGDNPIINVNNYINNGNPQIIYVRLFDPITECYDTGQFDLMVSLPPVAIQPTQLSECDDLGEVPGDEYTVFDLTVKNSEITGGNGSWSVDYYETNEDAQAQDNAIPDPTQYTNTEINGQSANPQTLFAVVTDTNTGCVDMVTLTLRVLPNPTPTPSNLLPNIELCDDLNTGDGIEVFDLTVNETLIRNGELGVTISYYETQYNADLDIDPIPDPTQYTNIDTPEQEIYVRMTKVATGCYALVDFTIVVHPLPEVVAVTDFIQCELFTDGFDNFDLITKNEEVLNGQDPTQFVVSYHENLADAEAGINGITSSYTNLSNPQQIFVTITNMITGCSISTQSFYIEVQEAAQANPNMVPIIYETCDDNVETDGDTTNDSAQFDLTTRDAEVLDGQDPLNYIVTYFATQEEADLNVNPLPALYENSVNPQVIYARVDNDTLDTTGNDTSICYEVAALTLQVNPLPEFNLEENYTLCLNTNGTEILEPLVIDTGLSIADYSFAWTFEGVLLSETSSSIMPTQGGNYEVYITNLVTGCENDDSTLVIESEPPSLSVELLTQAFADNHVLEAIAIGMGVYEYSLDGGPWQDEGTFTNVSSGDHEITARDKNGCGLTVTTTFIIDYPLYFTPNGDGNNETWNIEGIGSTAKIYIFDRYGKLLKQISPDGEGWNGTYNGNALPTGGYWFTVEYDEPSSGIRKEFRSHFTLKR
ncbi:Ig-like domain-containing protein [Winogradskyella helgolandensis]|uniref:Ig-like domain-containing protein n=1 Tax=Winogradskyella helgolandensis TaxID=2697010 RepID=UPI001FD0B024|nr:T9SS type B sorting domain-containing protein [Winogradskyella helgolandensis]